MMQKNIDLRGKPLGHKVPRIQRAYQQHKKLSVTFLYKTFHKMNKKSPQKPSFEAYLGIQNKHKVTVILNHLL